MRDRKEIEGEKGSEPDKKEAPLTELKGMGKFPRTFGQALKERAKEIEFTAPKEAKIQMLKQGEGSPKVILPIQKGHSPAEHLPKESEPKVIPGRPLNEMPTKEELEGQGQQVVEATEKLAKILKCSPGQVMQALNIIMDGKSETPAALIDGNDYKGPFYSCQNKITKEIRYAVQMPGLYVITNDKGTFYGDEGDFLIVEFDRDRIELRRQSFSFVKFAGMFTWIPYGTVMAGLDNNTIVESERQEKFVRKAEKIETHKTQRACTKLKKLYDRAWGVDAKVVLDQEGIAISPPPAKDVKILPAENEGPKYGFNFARWPNGYCMITDLGGMQYPKLQGKAHHVIPELIEMLKESEKMETYGRFSYNMASLYNFVEKFYHHGNKILETKDIFNEWVFAFEALDYYKKLIECRPPKEMNLTKAEADGIEAALCQGLNAFEMNKGQHTITKRLTANGTDVVINILDEADTKKRGVEKASLERPTRRRKFKDGIDKPRAIIDKVPVPILPQFPKDEKKEV